MAELSQLSQLPTVKLLVSSRPWPIFERGLGQSPNQITLEEVNRQYILHYVCDRLQGASVDELSAHVDWDALERQSLKDGTSTSSSGNDPSESLVLDILAKADGVFLWVSLVLDALCERLASGEDLISLKERVDDFPSELEEYFRKLIYDRIPETYRFSDTAMALYLQLAFLGYHWKPGHIEYFILCRGLRRPQNFILRPSFESETSFGAYDETPEDSIIREPQDFIGSCCRDLLKPGGLIFTTNLNSHTGLYLISYRRQKCNIWCILIYRSIFSIDTLFLERSFLDVRRAGRTSDEDELRRSLMLGAMPEYLLEMPEQLLTQHELTAIHYMKPGGEGHGFDWSARTALCILFLLRDRRKYVEQVLQREPATVCYVVGSLQVT